jgi:hypothetical protein
MAIRTVPTAHPSKQRSFRSKRMVLSLFNFCEFLFDFPD